MEQGSFAEVIGLIQIVQGCLKEGVGLFYGDIRALLRTCSAARRVSSLTKEWYSEPGHSTRRTSATAREGGGEEAFNQR